MKTLGRTADAGMIVGVGVGVAAAVAAEARGLSTSTGVLCLMTVAPLRTTAETATDLGILFPLERITDTRGSKGGIHQSLEDPTKLDINTLVSRGHPSTGDDDLKGQIDAILGQDGRGNLVGEVMEGATTAGARLQISSLGSAA